MRRADKISGLLRDKSLKREGPRGGGDWEACGGYKDQGPGKSRNLDYLESRRDWDTMNRHGDWEAGVEGEEWGRYGGPGAEWREEWPSRPPCHGPRDDQTVAPSNDSYKCIESYLEKQGGVAATYFLSPDATARQLLLCFGFFLSGGIIENNINKVLKATPLGEEFPSFMADSDTTTDDLIETFARPDEDDPQALLNYALFVYGKLQHNLKAVANYSQERVKLFSKIHKATVGVCGSPHLSVGDLLMTVRPELQLEFCSKCQHCIPLLEAYSKWHRKRHIFWEWMMTVVEEEFKVKAQQHSVAEITHLHEFLRKLKSYAQKAQVTEDENSSKDSNTPVPVTSRRMCLSGNGEVVDSMIEDLDLKIKNLQIDNEKKIKQIKLNLHKSGDQLSAVNSILQVVCDTDNVKKLKRKVELPSVEKLKIDSTD